MRAILLSFTLGLWLGCDAELTAPTSDSVALIDAEKWRLVDAAEDPFDDRPQTPVCPSTGFGIEDVFFEVETDVCHYATFKQPSLLEVAQNQQLRLNFWHSPLSSPQPAQAHIAFQINDQILWEKTIEIPNGAAVFEEIITLNEDIHKDDNVFFHLHNHGNNSWRLGTLETMTP